MVSEKPSTPGVGEVEDLVRAAEVGGRRRIATRCGGLATPLVEATSGAAAASVAATAVSAAAPAVARGHQSGAIARGSAAVSAAAAVIGILCGAAHM